MSRLRSFALQTARMLVGLFVLHQGVTALDSHPVRGDSAVNRFCEGVRAFSVGVLKDVEDLRTASTRS
jgi:hypothetical protein